MFPIIMLSINVRTRRSCGSARTRSPTARMTIGALIAFLTYFTLILTAVMMATFVAVMAPRAAVSAERIQEVLDTEPSVVAPVKPVTRGYAASGTLELRDVSFGYPGAEADVLHGVSFEARPGETTAVIGEHGSGQDDARQRRSRG